MNKKYILFIISILLTHLGYAQQVGINTDDPQATLDVNGTLRVRKSMKLGGNEGIIGDPGKSETTILTSGGPGVAPIWGNIPSIVIDGGFAITTSVALSDEVGTVFLKTSEEVNDMGPQIEGMKLSENTATWKEIPGLAAQLSPKNAENVTVLSLQTVAQTSASSPVIADAVVSLGIFLDDKLVSVRSIQLRGSDMNFQIFNLMDAIHDLPVKPSNEPYKLQVATQLRRLIYPAQPGPPSDSSDCYVLVGTGMSVALNTNAFMNKSSLKIDLYEKIN